MRINSANKSRITKSSTSKKNENGYIKTAKEITKVGRKNISTNFTHDKHAIFSLNAETALSAKRKTEINAIMRSSIV